jgi:hypothetical protein
MMFLSSSITTTKPKHNINFASQQLEQTHKTVKLSGELSLFRLNPLVAAQLQEPDVPTSSHSFSFFFTFSGFIPFFGGI